MLSEPAAEPCVSAGAGGSLSHGDPAVQTLAHDPALDASEAAVMPWSQSLCEQCQALVPS